MPSSARRNIELKARLRDLAGARETAERLAKERPGTQHQLDTYFRCPTGRLKLREITTDDGERAELIYYHRADQASAKASDYRIVPVSDPIAFRELITAAFGVIVGVEKRREVFLYHNVRIHLDEVTDLGHFLEFEAVLGDEIDDQTGHEQVAWLKEQFGIADADLLNGSYADMLAAQ